MAKTKKLTPQQIRRRNHYLKDIGKAKLQAKQWRASNLDRVKQTSHAWYVTNKESHISKNKLKKQEMKRWGIAYLGNKCKRCSGIFDPCVFDFHHRNPNDKEFQITPKLGGSLDKLKHELDKCDLLCSNCHRLTHQEWRHEKTTTSNTVI